MRRIVLIVGALAVAGLLIALPATGADDDGPYRVRAVFDNGSFLVKDEDVQIAGARWLDRVGGCVRSGRGGDRRR